MTIVFESMTRAELDLACGNRNNEKPLSNANRLYPPHRKLISSRVCSAELPQQLPVLQSQTEPRSDFKALGFVRPADIPGLLYVSFLS